jgi:prophage regulatory protein
MKFLRFEKLKDYGIDWSRVHTLHLEKAGKFPKRVRMGENSIAYVESEILAWLEARAAERAA